METRRVDVVAVRIRLSNMLGAFLDRCSIASIYISKCRANSIDYGDATIDRLNLVLVFFHGHKLRVIFNLNVAEC